MDVAVSRSLGGTSRWWGGRCVFLDDIDFQQREYVPDSGWPIDFDDLAPYLPRAAELLGCNDGPFSAPDWNETGDPARRRSRDSSAG
jgi:choline dehydrogenase-like flavoprotein